MQVDARTINLNTVISLAGFLATFVMIGIAWGNAQCPSAKWTNGGSRTKAGTVICK